MSSLAKPLTSSIRSAHVQCGRQNLLRVVKNPEEMPHPYTPNRFGHYFRCSIRLIAHSHVTLIYELSRPTYRTAQMRPQADLHCLAYDPCPHFRLKTSCLGPSEGSLRRLPRPRMLQPSTGMLTRMPELVVGDHSDSSTRLWLVPHESVLRMVTACHDRFYNADKSRV